MGLCLPRLIERRSLHQFSTPFRSLRFGGKTKTNQQKTRKEKNMPKPLPKNLGGLAPRFWKEIKKKNKLSKDEDLEKNLLKLEAEFAGISTPPAVAECESIKKHLLKARVSAAKVMQKNKQDLVVTFCEAVLEWTTRHGDAVEDALNAALGRAARQEVAISADIFSLAASKFPDNKAVKAFATDKTFTLFILEGQKPVKDPQLAQCQAAVKTRLANLKKWYAALGKLSKVKNGKPGELVSKVQSIYDGIGEQLAPMQDGIGAQVKYWMDRVQALYGPERKAQYLKYQKNPAWQIAGLAGSEASKEYNAYAQNANLVDIL
jgi:hypothetical protein